MSSKVLYSRIWNGQGMSIEYDGGPETFQVFVTHGTEKSFVGGYGTFFEAIKVFGLVRRDLGILPEVRLNK